MRICCRRRKCCPGSEWAIAPPPSAHEGTRKVSFCLAGLITAAAGAGVLDDTTIRDAVAAWLADATAAEATYGHILSLIHI